MHGQSVWRTRSCGSRARGGIIDRHSRIEPESADHGPRKHRADETIPGRRHFFLCFVCGNPRRNRKSGGSSKSHPIEYRRSQQERRGDHQRVSHHLHKLLWRLSGSIWRSMGRLDTLRKFSLPSVIFIDFQIFATKSRQGTNFSICLRL